MKVNQVSAPQAAIIVQSRTSSGDGLAQKVTIIVKKAFYTMSSIFDPLVSLFGTQPLADALGLKTLTHGTNFSNYLNIRCHGADPARGGSNSGSTAAAAKLGIPEDTSFRNEIERSLKECYGHFYLFKDISDFKDDEKKRECQKMKGPLDLFNLSEKHYVRSLLPMRHAVLAGIAFHVPDKAASGFMTNCQRVLGVLDGLFTPTISVRIDPSDPLMKKLEIDPDFPEMAYRTKAYISQDYLGAEGIIKQGFKSDLRARIQRAPVKATIGFLRLLNPIGLVTVAYVLARVAINNLFLKRVLE
jgi:hypothetical protein